MLATVTFYVYILRCANGAFYVGHTEDLKARVNAGKCPHTARHKPWRVKFYAAFESGDLARRFERYLKSGSGHAFAHRHLGW